MVLIQIKEDPSKPPMTSFIEMALAQDIVMFRKVLLSRHEPNPESFADFTESFVRQIRV